MAHRLAVATVRARNRRFDETASFGVATTEERKSVVTGMRPRRGRVDWLGRDGRR